MKNRSRLHFAFLLHSILFLGLAGRAQDPRTDGPAPESAAPRAEATIHVAAGDAGKPLLVRGRVVSARNVGASEDP
jgi:hypothetical protein